MLEEIKLIEGLDADTEKKIVLNITCLNEALARINKSSRGYSPAHCEKFISDYLSVIRKIRDDQFIVQSSRGDVNRIEILDLSEPNSKKDLLENILPAELKNAVTLDDLPTYMYKENKIHFVRSSFDTDRPKWFDLNLKDSIAFQQAAKSSNYSRDEIPGLRPSMSKEQLSALFINGINNLVDGANSSESHALTPTQLGALFYHIEVADPKQVNIPGRIPIGISQNEASAARQSVLIPTERELGTEERIISNIKEIKNAIKKKVSHPEKSILYDILNKGKTAISYKEKKNMEAEKIIIN